MITLPFRVFLVVGLFPFSTLNISYYSVACKFLLKNQLIVIFDGNQMSLFPFLLMLLRFCLYLCVPLRFILFGVLSSSWTWMSVFSPDMELFIYSSLTYVFCSFLCSYWVPYNVNLSMLEFGP